MTEINIFESDNSVVDDTIGYPAFLARKTQLLNDGGFEPLWIPDFLFPFQRVLTEWALRKGRAALFEDCLAGESIIHSPDGDKTIAEATAIGKPMRVFTRSGISESSAPWISGFGSLYEITMSTGRKISASAGHEFFTRRGWTRLDALRPGERLLISDVCHLPSIWEHDLSIRAGGDPSSSQKAVGLKERYLPCLHPYGEQPRIGTGIDQYVFPSLVDAPSRNLCRAHSDVMECERKHIRHGQYSFRHSTKGFRTGLENDYAADGEFQGASSIPKRPSTFGQSFPLSEEFGRRGLRVLESFGLFRDQMSEDDQFSYWDIITAIHYVREDFFFDLHVPEHHHFLANGIWSHNCGLGKTIQQLVWAQNVVQKTNKPVLILTPLSVGPQTLREASKFGIEAAQSRDGKISSKITITNYQQLHKFDWQEFGGVACDESSILKNFDGAIKQEVTEFMRKLPYRLLCTATAAPNDYIELGTSSEALGQLGFVDMVSRFFKKSENTFKRSDEFRSGLYRFRGHSERDFWRWICSWARAVRKPSDIGFSDEGYSLPELVSTKHVIKALTPNPDFLFDLPAIGLKEQRKERRRTVDERCEKAASLIVDTGKPAVAWCHLNDEGKLMEKLIPDSVEVEGSDSDEFKEETFDAFATGQIRVLISKPVIAGFGLNWQHCAHQTFFPSHSFEQLYQGVRRCWRFGQKKPVHIDIITSEGEADVLDNMNRKAAQAEEMFSRLVSNINNELKMEKKDLLTNTQKLPSWL